MKFSLLLLFVQLKFTISSDRPPVFRSFLFFCFVDIIISHFYIFVNTFFKILVVILFIFRFYYFIILNIQSFQQTPIILHCSFFRIHSIHNFKKVAIPSNIIQIQIKNLIRVFCKIIYSLFRTQPK